MLRAMRRGAQGFFVKVLLILLALSFVTWGVGDIFRGRTGNDIAKVGELAVSVEEYQQKYRNEKRNIENMFGRALTSEEVVQYDLKNRVMSQITGRNALIQRAEALNLEVGEAMLRDELLKVPYFFDESGEFSRDKLQAFLRQRGMSEKAFVDRISQDATADLLRNVFAVNTPPAPHVGQTLFDIIYQMRQADVMKINPDVIDAVEEPSETNLVQFYQENPELFTAPELREVEYITIAAEDVSKTVTLPEQEIRDYYDLQKDSYAVPESRSVTQYLFTSEEEALEAYQALTAPDARDDAYRDTRTDLPAIGQGQLPDEADEVVFELEENVLSQPVQTVLGWHIFRLTGITPSYIQEYEKVKEEIETELKAAKVAEVLYEIGGQIEDAIAAGQSLSDIGQSFDLVLHKVAAIDADGNGATGKPVSQIPSSGTFIPLVFSTSMDQDPQMEILPETSAYLLLDVVSVMPERVKALDEVRGTAVEEWKAQEKQKRLEALADSMHKDVLEKGRSMQELAKEHGLISEEGVVFKRARMAPTSELGETEAFLNELFAIKTGELTDVYETLDGSLIFASLKEVQQPDPTSEEFAPKYTNLEMTLKDSMSDDLLQQYLVYLGQVYPVSYNEALIDTIN